MFDHHVTCVAVFGQRQMTETVKQKYNNQQSELAATRHLIMLESRIYHSV